METCSRAREKRPHQNSPIELSVTCGTERDIRLSPARKERKGQKKTGRHRKKKEFTILQPFLKNGAPPAMPAGMVRGMFPIVIRHLLHPHARVPLHVPQNKDMECCT
eukprot:scaffold193196_cov17-Tisochrysis_lutea.AAC.1